MSRPREKYRLLRLPGGIKKKLESVKLIWHSETTLENQEEKQIMKSKTYQELHPLKIARLKSSIIGDVIIPALCLAGIAITFVGLMFLPVVFP
jgi:hypothetical protein